MPGWASLFRGRKTASHHGTHRRPHRSKTSGKTVTSKTPDLTTPDVDKLGATKEDDHTKQKPAQPLGVQHLGKFAHEDEMPGWLVEKLAKDGQICTHDVIPALTKLVAKSRSISYAYFCHPCVQHVSKLRREGGFCGYRNIQALISYIIGARTLGHQHFSNGLPSVLEIQDLIESAWDSGHNSSGRLETGGIRRTRKFIGTPEAQALFKGLKIPCSVTAFRPVVAATAWKDMVLAIEMYFAEGWAAELGSKVRATNRPPVYLQHHGHSLTVVGFEKNLGGASCLYVFDPSSRDPGSMKTKISRGSKQVDTKSDALIDVYRRGEAYLCKYSEFEVLFLRESNLKT